MKKILIVLQLFCFAFLASGQNVFLDTSFGNGGIVITPETTEIAKSVILPDGKILVCDDSNSDGAFRISRWLSSGSLDLSFNNTGIMDINITEGHDYPQRYKHTGR